jgi:hypothetical protein
LQPRQKLLIYLVVHASRYVCQINSKSLIKKKHARFTNGSKAYPKEE